MNLPNNHHYDLHLKFSGSETLRFSENKKLNLLIICAVCSTFWLAYWLQVKDLPLIGMNILAHFLCLTCGTVSLLMGVTCAFKHEELVLDKRKASATYRLQQFRKDFEWSRPLSDFVLLNMQLVTVDSDEVWECVLVSNDGMHIPLSPKSPVLILKKHRNKAEVFAREIANFIGCKLVIDPKA